MNKNLKHKILSLLFLFLSCKSFLTPSATVAKSTGLRAPDYSSAKDWLVLPSKSTKANEIPENGPWKENQKNAEVDVFYIHPTSYLKGDLWNADLDDEKLNFRTEDRIGRKQVSLFNSVARIYAPRYRQAVLASFFEENREKGDEALALAYGDIRTAFKYYLENQNKGRPWILAGHSQGTRHAVQLLKEFQNDKIFKNLVAAYIIGFPFSKDEVSFPFCKSEKETGCIITWNTILKGTEPTHLKESFETAECVNPLTWKMDGVYGPPELHLGGVGASFKLTEKKLLGAVCEKGVLYIDPPKSKQFKPIGTGNYHVYDLGLFYGNIRDNLEKRVASYLSGKK